MAIKIYNELPLVIKKVNAIRLLEGKIKSELITSYSYSIKDYLYSEWSASKKNKAKIFFSIYIIWLNIKLLSNTDVIEKN